MKGIVIKNNIGATKNIFFYSFLFLYTAAIVFLCVRLNISNDEIFSINTTSNDLPGVIRQSYNFEGQPPLYFILLAIWRLINSSILFARLFSVLFVALSALFFHRIIKLISGTGCSRWLIILFLLNPYIVWTALEIRLYSFVVFLGAAAVYFLLRFYINKEKRYIWFFIATCIVGIYTQYLFIYLVVALAPGILLFKGWKTFFQYCLYTLPVGLLLLHSLLFTTNPMKLAYINSISNSITETILIVLHTPQNLLLGLHLLDVERVIRWGFMLLFIILIAVSYLKWYKSNKTGNKVYFKSFNALMIAAFVLLIIMSVFFAVTKIDYHDRYLGEGFPLFIAVFVLFQAYPLVKRSIIFGTIALLYGIMLLSSYKYQVKEYDTRSLTKYIATIEKQGEPICFYHKVLSLQFKYNYEGKNILVPLPDGLQFDSSYLSKIKDTADLRQSIEKANPNSNSYLLISDRTEVLFQNDPDVKMLDTYLPIHYNITLDTLFSGNNKLFPLRIRRLEKK